MEEEAEKLKEMQKEVDTQMNLTSPTTASKLVLENLMYSGLSFLLKLFKQMMINEDISVGSILLLREYLTEMESFHFI